MYSLAGWTHLKTLFVFTPSLSTAWLCSSSSSLSFPPTVMCYWDNDGSDPPSFHKHSHIDMCMENLQNTYLYTRMRAHTHAVDCAACLPCRLMDIVFYTWSTRQPSPCWRVSLGQWTWWFWETAARDRNSFIIYSSPLNSAGGLWSWHMSRLFLSFVTFLKEHTDICLPIAGPKANTSAKCTMGDISSHRFTGGQGPDRWMDRPWEDATLFEFLQGCCSLDILVGFEWESYFIS